MGATIRDCSILNNRADFYGGGICASGDTWINGCTIAGNGGGGVGFTYQGGGVYGQNLHMTGCVITGNVSAAGGGGIDCSDSDLLSCTVSGNGSGNQLRGGGLRATDTWLRQTIIWGNCNLQNPGPDEIQSNGGVLLYCCDYDPAGVSGEITYEGQQVVSDPLFCEPEPCTNAPGTAGHYELDASSPCLPPTPCGDLIGALPEGCGGVPSRAACCVGTDCQVLTEAECAALKGTWHPDVPDCDPDPCPPVPTEITTWGRIKARYR